MREIYPRFFIQKYAAKALVFCEGERADSLYFIKDGVFKVSFS